MSSRDYFVSELAYLHEMGREFARAHPDATRYLGEAGADPDVERLLEGVAFLTGRIREKLDDEQPQFVKGLLDLFLPQYLRPFPSCCMQQFTLEGAEQVHVPAGSMVHTERDGTPCYFRTAIDCPVAPVRVLDISIDRSSQPKLLIDIECDGEVPLTTLAEQPVRLFCAGDGVAGESMFALLCHFSERFELQARHDERLSIPLAQDCLKPVGFAADDVLLPHDDDAFVGFQHLVEYWHFPEKFRCIDWRLDGPVHRLGENRQLRLVCHLNRWPQGIPPLGPQNLLTNCTPVINIFPLDAAPITLDPVNSQYRLIPQMSGDEIYEIYRVDTVRGRLRDGSGIREYAPVFKRSRTSGEDAYFYEVSSKRSIIDNNLQWHLRLAGGPMLDLVDQVDVLSIECTCTNGLLPLELGLGDITGVAADYEGLLATKNISRPTPRVLPPAQDESYWRLLGQLAMNYRSLESLDSLRQTLRNFNFAALLDRQAERRQELILDGITQVQMKTGKRLFGGVLVNGVDISIALSDDHFGGDGGMFIFGCVLNELFAHLVSLNAFSRLQVQAISSRETFTWPARIGRRSIV